MLMPLQRRGLRAIKKMMPKATKASADGVVRPRNVSSQMTTPSAPIRNGTIFLMGAATPPSQVFARRGIRCHAPRVQHLLVSEHRRCAFADRR